MLTTITMRTLALFGFMLCVAGCTTNQAAHEGQASYLKSDKLETFADDSDLASYANRVAKANKIKLKRKDTGEGQSGTGLEAIVVTTRKATADVATIVETTNTAITNNQERGVDEGDIVKVIGEYLIVLRQGELYSIRIGSPNNSALQPMDRIAVFKPGWKHDAWYDEMIVRNNLIVVTGYDYCWGQRCPFEGSVSELNFIRLQPDGRLEHIRTLGIQSGDYFDGDNYASRIVDGRLRIYLPVDLWPRAADNNKSFIFDLPAIGVLPEQPGVAVDWQPLLQAQDIYKPLQTMQNPTLHTFVDCALDTPDIECDAFAIVGTNDSVNYSSLDATYLWTEGDGRSEYRFWQDNQPGKLPERETYYPGIGYLYRIAGSERSISVVELEGSPVNQFAFAERGDTLFALTNFAIQHNFRTEESIYYPRLYTIPLTNFGRADSEPMLRTDLPSLSGRPVVRFTQDHLTIGNHYSEWNEGVIPDFSLIIAALDGSATRVMTMPHSANRLEPVDAQLFVLGLNRQQRMEASVINFFPTPSPSAWIGLHDYLEAESRSHAFNYQHTEETGGLIGFTTHWRDSFFSVTEAGTEKFEWDWEKEPVSNVTFLRLSAENSLYPAGTLDGRGIDSGFGQMKCEFSCIDWYGNTRPFFIGYRIFALSGFTLIEAGYFDGVVAEVQQVDIRELQP